MRGAPWWFVFQRGGALTFSIGCIGYFLDDGNCDINRYHPSFFLDFPMIPWDGRCAMAANGIGWLDDCWFSMIILNHSNQILTKSCKHKENLYENCFFNNTVGCLIILSTTKQPGSIFVHGTSPFAWLSPRRSNLAMENQPVRLSCVKSLEGNTNSTPTVLCFNQCNLHMFYIVLHLTTLNYTYFDG